jgi:hypothetical protein
MDDELIEKLLYMGEGTTLDYKVQQYVVSGSDNDIKSELLKDILAFANAWRKENAYILVGVRNDNQELVGLDADPDDARLQQFINGKTNHPIHFSYRSLTYKGVKLGLYTILPQERPVYARQNFGRVLAQVVYVRRGSSTAIADPTEIAKMGAASVSNSQTYSPDLSLQLVGLDEAPVDRLNFEYAHYILNKYPKYELPPASRGKYDPYIPSFVRANENYYENFALYAQQQAGLCFFRLKLTNTGNNFAEDVRVYMTMPRSPDFRMLEKTSILEEPEATCSILNPPSLLKMPSFFSVGSVDISSTAESEVVVFRIGKILSGETLHTKGIYLVCPSQSVTEIKVRILSDQLRDPLEVQIPVEITEKQLPLTIDMLRTIIDRLARLRLAEKN